VSTFGASLAASYLTTRLPASRFGPLAIALVLASLTGESVPTLGTLLQRLLLATSLIVQFRIWDDLADRQRDRDRHPERILPAARRLGPFHGLWVVAAAAAGALLALGPCPAWRLSVYGLFGLALGLWYTAGRRRWTQSLLHYHVVLAKYPVFVYLIGGGTARPLPRVLAALSVYLALCAYEVLHDPETAGVPGARRALQAEVAALLTASAALIVTLFWEVPS
jgi:4-hydroxybenzoate polyprenyltransferase